MAANPKSLIRLLLAGGLASLLTLPIFAKDRYETWIQGDTRQIGKGQTALIIFASPDCQIKMTRPGCKTVTLKIEPSAKVISTKRPITGNYIPYQNFAALRVTSPDTPVALVGPVVLTIENSSGPKLHTSYVSAMITDTEF